MRATDRALDSAIIYRLLLTRHALINTSLFPFVEKGDIPVNFTRVKTRPFLQFFWRRIECFTLSKAFKKSILKSRTAVVLAVADLGEGPRGPGPPLFVEYLQKIYKKMTEMSIQKPF